MRGDFAHDLCRVLNQLVVFRSYLFLQFGANGLAFVYKVDHFGHGEGLLRAAIQVEFQLTMFESHKI